MLQQLSLQSQDTNNIPLYIWESPSPHAIIQLIHGTAEHARRYDYFAKAAASQGFIVAAHDQRGHGSAISEIYPRGYIGEPHTVLDDIFVVNRYLHETYPQLPVIVMGHSWGSFEAREFAISHPDQLDALIAMGTGDGAGLVNRLGYSVASLECSRRGTHYYSRALQELAFGPFNRAFENPRTAFDWLSRDPAQVDAYLRDPLCGFTMTTGFFKALVGLTLTVSKPRRIARMSKDLPILLISGANDPVGGQGKGVRAVARTLQKAGLSEVTMRLYPEARHEILNELNRDEVIADLLAWAQSVIAGDKIPAATTL